MMRSSPLKTPLPISVVVRNYFPPLAFPSQPGRSDQVKAHETGTNVSFTGADVSLDIDGETIVSDGISDSENRCEFVSREVLLKLRLDIVIKNKMNGENVVPGNNCTGYIDETKKSTSIVNQHHSETQSESFIYSVKTNPIGKANPHWDHFNEQITILCLEHQHNNGESNWEADIYPFLYVRFVIIHHHEHTLKPLSKEDIGISEKEHETILAEIPLHPSKLRTLPSTPKSASATIATINTPMFLPPNAVLIQYNDGLTRVIPSLYLLLLHRGIIEKSTNPLMSKLTATEEDMESRLEHAREEKVRFNDTEFDALGDGPVDQGKSLAGVIDEATHEERTQKTQSVYGDDKVFDLLETHVKDKTFSGNVINDQALHDSEKNISIHSTLRNDKSEQSNIVIDAGAKTESAKDSEAVVMIAVDKIPSLSGSKTKKLSNYVYDIPQKPHDVSNPVKIEYIPPFISRLEDGAGNLKSSVVDIEHEISVLRKLVQFEQELLEQDKQLIFEDTDCLRSMISQVKQLQERKFVLVNATSAERATLFRSNCRLEAHRTHLIHQLQLIFPIKIINIRTPSSATETYLSHPQHQYTIAGIPLSDDIHDPFITDEQVSTALGFVCHLITLTSKYLDIPLRYRMVCKFSRSAIIDDQGRNDSDKYYSKSAAVVYPLFRERNVVDKDQLESGFMLLKRNVDSLLDMRQVHYHQDANILSKIERLFAQVIEREDPSFDFILHDSDEYSSASF